MVVIWEQSTYRLVETREHKKRRKEERKEALSIVRSANTLNGRSEGP